ncbi:MAG: T9SS type A sorting domain-containing protein [Bacteroidota bacterium]
MKKKFYSLVTLGLLTAFCANAQIITTIAGKDRIPAYGGDGGPAVDARLWGPSGIARDGAGNLYIADQYNHVIRKINTSGVISTVAGNDTAGFSGDGGQATSARLNNPRGVTVDGDGNLYIADMYNNRIRKVDGGGIITTVAGTGVAGYNGDNILATVATLHHPRSMKLDKFGNIFIADMNNHRVRKITAGTGVITTIAGMGVAYFNGDFWPAATQASLNSPSDVLIDDTGNVYIADAHNNRVRKVDTFRRISTIAGNPYAGYCCDGGPATLAKLNWPSALSMDKYMNLYIADEYNSRIRRITPQGTISTVVGNGAVGYVGDSLRATVAEVNHPSGVVVDSTGTVYFTEWSNNRVRKVTTSVGVNVVTKAEGAMQVYPNPSNGNFSINLSTVSDEQVTITVISMAGGKVTEVTGTTNKAISLGMEVAAGIYFLQATTANGSWTEKIQVMH